MKASRLRNEVLGAIVQHGEMSVYTTDDAGRLVPVEGVEVIMMRDGGEETPVLVIKR